MSSGITDFGMGAFSTDGFQTSGASPASVDLDSSLVRQTKTQIRQLVSEVAQLSQEQLATAEYFRSFLPKVTAALGAIGGAIWQKNQDDQWIALAIHQLPPGLAEKVSTSDQLDPNNPAFASAAHIELLDCVHREQQPVLVPPGSVPLSESRPANPTEHLIIIVPVSFAVSDESSIQIEIVQRASGGPATHRGYLRFVAQMADLARDYLKNRRLYELRSQREKHEAYRDLILSLHGNLSLSNRWHHAAKELAEIYNASQATIIEYSIRYGRRQANILGISSTSTIEQRGHASSLIKQWATQQPSRSQDWNSEVTAQEELSRLPDSLALKYHTLFKAQWSQWLPISDGDLPTALGRKNQATDQTIIGAVLLHGETYDRGAQIADVVDYDSHVKPILSTAISGYHSPNKWLSPFSKSYAGKNPRRNLWLLDWLLKSSAATIFAIAIFWPVPDRVMAPAVLRPAQQQICYAPADAIVSQVLVKHDQSVEPGQVLLVLVDRQLETELEDLLGRQAEAESELSRTETALLRGSSLDSLETAQLEAEQRRWTQTLQTYRQKSRILRQRQDSLTIRASRAGRIATWQVESRLRDRPVRMGQILLSLYETDQPWQLEAEVPQRRAAQVLAASQMNNQKIPIKFTLNADPSQSALGIINGIHRQISQSQNGDSVLRLTADVDERELWLKKDGAAAEIAIDCGNQPFGWLLIRDAWQTVYGRFRLWL